ncbi:MAG: alpha-ketoacid dehydrogenase subunit beta [Anaerolineaceae bacterium]|nr:MAG: alpha-ketoacid dehydrogenase subunit beta [Anaerolineaceae bacterium]
MRELTYGQAIKEAMTLEMRQDEDVFLMGEDIGVYGGCFGVSLGMLEEFGPERVLETPISELGFVGAGIGSALLKMRPIVEIMFSDFSTVCYDQIVNQAAKIRYMFGGKNSVPIVIRMPDGAGTGAAAQHSQSPEAWYTNVPGLIIIAPSTPYDAKGLLISAIRNDNPVLFFEHKLLYGMKGEVPEEYYTLPIGKADIKREGSDITVATYGRMVHLCLSAAEELLEEGISLEVVDLRTLSPLDKRTIIESVKKTGRLLIVHEAHKTGGFGGEIAATVTESEAFYYLDSPIERCCSMDVPIPCSLELEKNVLPTKERIIASARGLMK